MSVSSSSSETTPSDTELEEALRNAVRKTIEAGNTEGLTVKRVRVCVERDLGLSEGFFKESEWKDRSKVIIEEEALKHDQAESQSNTPVKKARSSKPPIRPSAIESNPSNRKRKIIEGLDSDVVDETRGPKRRSKTKTVLSDDEESASVTQTPSRTVEIQAKKTPKSAKAKPIVKGDSSNDESSLSDAPSPSLGAVSTSRVEYDLGDSDLSEVLDEAPKPKRKRKAADKKVKAEPNPSGKHNKSQDSDPQAEEIKSLQGWLVKCGIRKVWGKELKPYETAKEKIRHLKGMLAGVGMTGRYSKEKAASIRETRELAADLEAVQEGAKLWGKEGDDQKAERRRPTKTTLPQIEFVEYDSED